MPVPSGKPLRIAVAMSGGVDSSAVASLLKEEGHEVIGVTLRLRCYGRLDEVKRPCCSLEAVAAARRVANRVGIPHFVVDLAAEFDAAVVGPFCLEYARGRTPNPCVLCNRHIKFGRLLERVGTWGATHLATGHYARLEFHTGSSRWRLLEGRDERKDQSYFLWSIPRDNLPRLIFPLGEWTKAEVRRYVLDRELGVGSRPESQEICFSSRWQEFVRDRWRDIGLEMIPGPILDTRDRLLGQHRGIGYYTVGQRSRLGVALGSPRYVVRIDPERNALILGEEGDLYHRHLLARGLNWYREAGPGMSVRVRARIRHRHCPAAAAVRCLAADEVRVDFDEPQRAITPGQSVVFYDGEEVLGGGDIERVVE